MSLRPEQIRLMRLGFPVIPANGGGIFGGGGTRSSATYDNSVKNDTKMPVTDGGSVGVAADNSTVSVSQTSTDLGAIEKAFDFATNSRKGVSEDFVKVVNMAGESLDFAKETARMTASAQSNATDQLSKAMTVVQENITGNKYLVTLGLIVAGIVALAAFGSKIGKVQL